MLAFLQSLKKGSIAWYCYYNLRVVSDVWSLIRRTVTYDGVLEEIVTVERVEFEGLEFEGLSGVSLLETWTKGVVGEGVSVVPATQLLSSVTMLIK
jgi:hypothetical protein